MKIYKQIKSLLSNKQQSEALILIFLLLIGMFLEMIGVGVIIPTLSIIMNPVKALNYSFFLKIFNFLGKPSQMYLVIYGMLFLVLVYLFKAFFLMYLAWRQSKFTMFLSADLSNRLFSGYLRQPYYFHLNRNSAELLRNIQTEVNQFTTVSQAFMLLITEFTVIVGVVSMLVFIEPLGAIIVFSFLIVSAVFFHRLTRNKLLNWGEQRQFHDGEANRHLLQGLTGVKEVKLSGTELYFLNEYNVHNFGKASVYTSQTTLQQAPRFYLELLAVIGLSFLVIIITLQSKPIEIMFPIIGVFVAAAFRLIPSANRIIGSMQVMRYGRPVIDILEKEFSSIQSKLNSENKNTEKINFEKSIEIKNLTFSYTPEMPQILNAVSIEIQKGEIVGIIGSSGSGKSTLIDILLGLLDSSNGKIRVDGFDISGNLSSWQSIIGYVPQTIFLIDDTLEKNIAFGISSDKIEQKLLEQSIESAQLNEFINNLPQKLNTAVGERGVRLSGGQRQRIGIARAMYRKPTILVLDEATSALDSQTEAEVMSAILNLKRKITIIIVAHRLTTLKSCDKIIKIENGTVVKIGKPNDFHEFSDIN